MNAHIQHVLETIRQRIAKLQDLADRITELERDFEQIAFTPPPESLPEILAAGQETARFEVITGGAGRGAAGQRRPAGRPGRGNQGNSCRARRKVHAGVTPKHPARTSPGVIEQDRFVVCRANRYGQSRRADQDRCRPGCYLFPRQTETSSGRAVADGAAIPRVPQHDPGTAGARGVEGER